MENLCIAHREWNWVKMVDPQSQPKRVKTIVELQGPAAYSLKSPLSPFHKPFLFAFLSLIFFLFPFSFFPSLIKNVTLMPVNQFWLQ